jgi:hypothetical protein
MLQLCAPRADLNGRKRARPRRCDVSIAQQIATPTPASRTRRASAPLHPAPTARPWYALVRIVGLMTVTAMGAAFIVGAVAIAIMVVASNLGG